MPGLVLVLGERTVYKTALKKICPIRTFCGERGQDKIIFMNNNHMDKEKNRTMIEKHCFDIFPSWETCTPSQKQNMTCYQQPGGHHEELHQNLVLKP